VSDLIQKLILRLGSIPNNDDPGIVVLRDELLNLAAGLPESRAELEEELRGLRLLRDRVNNAVVGLEEFRPWGQNLGTVVEELVLRYVALKQESKELADFRPLAEMLNREKKSLIVVAQDKPYFWDVYKQIRQYEMEMDRWTEVDERLYWETYKRIRKEGER